MSRPPAHRGARLVAALAVATVVGTVAAPPLGATPASPTQPATAVDVTLMDQNPWVHPGEQLRMRLAVRGQLPADAVVHVDVHRQVGSRTTLQETMADDAVLESGVIGSWDTPIPAASTSANQFVETSGTIGPGGEAEPDEAGVYPVQVTVRSASSGDDLARLVTYLLWVPDEVSQSSRLSVSMVVDLGTSPSLQPDGSVQVDQAAIQEMRRRLIALNEAPSVPLSIAPVPESLDALADAGGSTAEQLLTALQGAIGNREVVARPYVDLDLSAMVDAGLLTEVPPEAQEGAQVIRDRFTDDRSDGPKEPMGNLWLLDGAVGPDDAAALRDLGISRAVVPQSAVAPVDTPEGPTPTGPVSLGDGGPVGMVADEGLAARVTGGAGWLDAQRFLAELMTIWGARPSVERGVVVRIPVDAAVDPTVLGAALRGLAGDGVTNPVGLSSLFQTVPPAGEDDQADAVQWVGDGGGPQLDGVTAPLHAAQKTLLGLAGMVDDSATISSLQRSLLVSLGSQTPDDQRQAYVDRVDATANLVRDTISAPEEFQITLTARDGTIPLAIDNSSDEDIALRVALNSSQLEFPDGDSFSLVVQPGRTTQDIRVETLTSGAMPLRITLTSPDGSIVLAQSNYVVRSTAISGVGLVLSVGAGAFLLLWWGRHWRTARRSRRLISTTTDPQAIDPHTM